MSDRCRICRDVLVPDARFCSACGTAVVAAAGPPAPERRIVTLMFADIVASTEVAQRLGLKEYRGILDLFSSLASQEVALHSGMVLQHYGDGVLAAFGIDCDAEDAAPGLATACLLTEVAPRELAGSRLRAGLHSGPVLCVLNTAGGLVTQVTGVDVNLVARVAESEAPGTVLATEVVIQSAGRIAQVNCRAVDGAPVPRL